MGATKRRRLMVNLDPEIAPLVELRAKQLNRSVSNYIETVLHAALAAEQILNEPRGEYKVAPTPKPPDKTSRTPGAGSRHRVSA